MNRIARLIGLAAVLLIVFFAAILASGLRLRSQTEQLRLAALETKRHQLEQFFLVAHPGPLPWTDAYSGALASILDCQIAILPSPANPGANPIPTAKTPWQFDYPLRDNADNVIAVLRVSAQPPPTVRLGEVYRKTAIILLILALGLLVVLVIALLFNLRQRPDPDNHKDNERSAIGNEFDSLTHLAKTTVKQGVDLEHERRERERADEDLTFQQILLNRSLEEKIQLGRELHDGIIQSLYATGLTFEAARNRLARDPAEADRLLDTGLKSLNASIRDVRSYINGLAPENLRHQSFAASVLSLTQTLAVGRIATFDLRIDEPAAARLTDNQSADLLQIIREAVSNSLRHGNADKITIRLHESTGELGLLVQDNGKGFDLTNRTARGHGLNNLQARADRIHATLRIVSAPNEGARTILTLPIHAKDSTT